MGKGDKKTAKGKRAQGSYGVTRKRKSSTKVAPAKASVKKVTEKAAKPAKEEKPKKEVAVKKVATAKKPAAEKKPVAEKKVAEKKPAAKKAPAAAKKTTKKED